jgi:TonB family protein
MKKIATFLFLISTIFLSAQNLEKKKGKVTTLHPNGKKESSGKVKNYQRQGVWKYWDLAGVLEKTVTYKDNTMQGLFTAFYTDGTISEQGNYEKGTKIGTWSSYYQGAKKASLLNYKEGKFEGLQQWWFENGEMREKTLYKNGQIEYRNTWYHTGKPRLVETYSNGQAEGEWRMYPDPSESRDTLPSFIDHYTAGKKNGVHLGYEMGVRTEEIYYKDGNLHGTYKKWDRSGTLGIDENYVNGQRDGLCRYFDKGRLIREVTYKKGKITGTEKEYYSGSGLTRQSWYSNGILDSMYTYFDNGNVESTRIYKYYPGFVHTEEYSLYTQFDKTGVMLQRGEYHFEQKDRYWQTFYPNGKTKSQTSYVSGKIMGTYKKWYQNGKLMVEIECEGANVVSEPKAWDEKGKVLKPGTKEYQELIESNKPGEVYNDPLKYRNRRMIMDIGEKTLDGPFSDEQNYDGPDVLINEKEGSQDEVYTYCEIMPEFPGGNDSMMKFIQRHIQYPQIDKENGIEGTVYLSFIVEKDGSISEVTLVRGVKGGKGLEKEAIRVIKMMPHWKPGQMNGEKVRCQMVIPIKFSLE